MRGYLVRVGVDQSFGSWNAPADPQSREYVYIPIPEPDPAPFIHGMETGYNDHIPAISKFALDRKLDMYSDLHFPAPLSGRKTHLDPDFTNLTYGDVGNRRGSGISELDEGDLLVFYAGLRPVTASESPLVYALIGLFIIDKILNGDEVPHKDWHQNAHTRCPREGRSDIIIWGKPDVSGRLRHYIPIGNYRERAYRVTPELLKQWGDLSVNNGYIQRSAVPPSFLDASKFYTWFQQQNPILLANNY